MLFLIPISQGQGLARWPWLTFGLIALNILIMVLAGPALYFEWNEAQQLHKQQDQMIRDFYGEYVRQLPSGVARPDLAEFRRRVEAGEVLPADSPQRADLNLLRARIKRIETGGALDLLTFNPARIRPWAFFTATFMHGGLLHLLGNMLFLYLVAPPLEERYGRLGLAGLYLAGGAVSHLGFALTHWGQDTILVGASGAIAGLMGMSLVRFPKVQVRIAYFATILIRVYWGSFYAPMWLLLPIWFMLQTIYMLVGRGQSNHVAYASHVSGFAFGALTALAIRAIRLEQRMTPSEVKEILDDQQAKLGFDAEQRLSMCRHLIRVGRSGEAIRELNILRREHPEDMAVAGVLCQAQFTAGFKMEGREKARRLLRDLLLRDDAAGCDALLDGCEAIFEALELDRNMLYKLAALLERGQFIERAAAIYQSTSLLHPHSLLTDKALLSAARLYGGPLNDAERAAQLCRTLIERSPSSAPAAQARQLLERRG